MTTNVHFREYLAEFFLESEMFRTKVVEKNKTHLMFLNSFSKIALYMR